MEPKRSLRPQTFTHTHTETRESSETLTWLEEMVVRMSHGIAEDGDFELEFRGEGFPETRAQLALIEADLLEDMYDAGALASTEANVDVNARARILEKLTAINGK